MAISACDIQVCSELERKAEKGNSSRLALPGVVDR